MVSQSSYLRCALVGLSPAENMWPESWSGSGPLWVNRVAPALVRDLSAYPSIAVGMRWCAKRGDVPIAELSHDRRLRVSQLQLAAALRYSDGTAAHGRRTHATSPGRHLAADVVGYSRFTGTDEEGTLTRLKALRQDLSTSR